MLFRDLGVMLCGLMFCSLDLRLHSWSHSFFLKGSIYLQVSSFINLFLACRIQGVQQSFFFSVSFCLCPFQSKLVVWFWYDVLKNYIALLCVSWRFTPLDKSVLHRSLVDNCISVPGSAEMVENIHESHA